MFGALVADYGNRFTAQIGAEMTPDRWKKRLIQLVKDYDPRLLVDGYDDAARQSPDFPPTMRQIQAAVRERHIQQFRVETATVKAPVFTGGIAGYIEHVLAPNAKGSALYEIEKMRRAVHHGPRGDMRSHVALYRKAKLASELDVACLAGMVAAGPAVNGFALCGREGCDQHGTISMSLTGSGPWYCRKHWMASQ